MIRPYQKGIACVSFIIMMLMLLCGLAFGQKSGGVVSNLHAFKVAKGTQGHEQLLPAESAKPGDVIEYQLNYRNQGGKSIGNLVATLPIPEGTEYLEASATPKPIMASIDGKRFDSMPLYRLEKQPDGSFKRVRVPASEYRALRWKVDTLSSGKSVTLKARVKLLAHSK